MHFFWNITASQSIQILGMLDTRWHTSNSRHSPPPRNISAVLFGPESIATHTKVKGKAISLQGWTGPKGSRRLRLPDFKTVST